MTALHCIKHCTSLLHCLLAATIFYLSFFSSLSLKALIWSEKMEIRQLWLGVILCQVLILHWHAFLSGQNKGNGEGDRHRYVMADLLWQQEHDNRGSCPPHCSYILPVNPHWGDLMCHSGWVITTISFIREHIPATATVLWSLLAACLHV